MSTLRSISPWRTSANFLKDHWKKLIILWLCGFLGPMLWLEVNQTQKALADVHKLTAHAEGPVSVALLYEELLNFVTEAAMHWLAAGFVMGIAYLTIVRYVLTHYDILQKEPLMTLFANCLKIGISRGLLSLFLTYSIIGLLLIGSFTIPIIGFMLQIALLITIALSAYIPVVILSYPKMGAAKLVVSILSMKFFANIRGLKWSVFFQAMSWQLFLMVSFSLTDWLSASVNDFDLIAHLPRHYFSLAESDNLSVLQYFAGGIEVILSSLSIAFVAVISGIYVSILQKTTALTVPLIQDFEDISA